MDYAKQFAVAEEYLRKGQKIVERQRERVARLKNKGMDTKEAQILLDTFITSVALLDRLRQDLAETQRRLALPIHTGRSKGFSDVVA
jgi:hypothetical protein